MSAATLDQLRGLYRPPTTDMLRQFLADQRGVIECMLQEAITRPSVETAQALATQLGVLHRLARDYAFALAQNEGGIGHVV